MFVAWTPRGALIVCVLLGALIGIAAALRKGHSVPTSIIGGVGVALVIKLGRNVSYDRVRDRNCIRFTIPTRRAGT